MSVEECLKAVDNIKACHLCLCIAHDGSTMSPCPKATSWKPCGTNSCQEMHSKLLHKENSITGHAGRLGDQDSGNTLLLVQDIEIHGQTFRNLWDMGLTVSLIMRAAAERLNLPGVSTDLMFL